MQLSGLVTVMPVHNGRNRNKRNKFKARQAVLEPLVEKELYWAMPIAPVDRCAGPADYTWDRKTLHQVLGDGHLTLPGSGEFGRYSQEVEDCLIYGLPTTCPVVNRVLVAMRSSSEAFVGEVRLAQRLENEIIGHRLITRHGDRFDQRIITCEWFNQKGTSAFARTVGPRHDQGTWELNERMMEAIIEHGPDIPVHNPHVDRDKGRPFSAE
ncbi:uncharacterized protein RHO25_002009 [Cercospora beticola]|uniref:Uncharacterized protein n=1 Tax=Cercospora beticola TaxID=122368 RepID=A0ABZ0NCX9_CERBT|nr:hypothetical protein RHO25_002009 [Cercospora beticola]